MMSMEHESGNSLLMEMQGMLDTGSMVAVAPPLTEPAAAATAAAVTGESLLD